MVDSCATAHATVQHYCSTPLQNTLQHIHDRVLVWCSPPLLLLFSPARRALTGASHPTNRWQRLSLGVGEGVKGRSEGKGWGEGVKGRRGEKKGWRKGREDGVRGEEGPCKGSCHLSLPSIQYLPFSVYRTPPVYHQSISSLSPVYRDVRTGRTGHRVGRGARATAATGAAKARISAHATSLSPVYI